MGPTTSAPARVTKKCGEGGREREGDAERERERETEREGECTYVYIRNTHSVLATIRRLLKIIGLCCKRAL